MNWFKKLSGGVTMLSLILLAQGCANEYVVFHSVTGDPIVISRRAYTQDACVAKVKEDASHLGVPLRYIQVRGTTFGRSLIWPFEAGYACEAAVGPEQPPSGVYPLNAQLQRQLLSY